LSATPFGDAPPLPPVEAYADEYRISAVEKPSAAAPTAPKGFTVLALDQAKNSIAGEIVQGLYGAGQLIAIVGAPNGGKTALEIDQLLAVAARKSWFNLKVAGGPVVYFAPEAPGSVTMRAKAAANAKYPGQRLPFYIATGTPQLGGDLTSLLDAERMILTIRQVESEEGEAVKVAAIDTLASCLGNGDENGDGMVRLVAAAKHIAAVVGCAVALIHHPSKGDAAGLRGHGSLAAACDTILTISVDELSGTRTATLIKSRDAATGMQFCFTLEQVTLPEPDSFGDPRTTIIVKQVRASDMPRKRPGGKAQEQLLNELERRYRTGETSWDRATVRKAGRGIGMHRNSPEAALQGLIKSGFVGGSDSRLTLKDPPEECT
jgi:putative DNA primase/helicase